jgi:DNA-binding transcriptional ArsR family regulator
MAGLRPLTYVDGYVTDRVRFVSMDAIALLADPTRRRIVALLAERDRPAGEIAAHFDIARPGVSRHLRLLREGGLVSVTRSGQQHIYRLEVDRLMEIDRWLAPIRGFWVNRLDALDTEVRRGRSALADDESPRRRRSQRA